MLEYQRDVPADSPDEVIELEKEHVREHLAAIADSDDDPTTHADQVHVWVERHPDSDDLLRIKGTLDADADAPYLKSDYQPFKDIDPELLRSAGIDG